MNEIVTETNGRYTEIYAEGFPDGSLAYDTVENEVVINATDWRITEQADKVHRLVVEMPDPIEE